MNLKRAGMTEPWLTKRELATALKVSTRTIERLRLPAMTVGGQKRYLLSQVERSLATDASLPENVVPLRPRKKERVA